MHEPFWEHNLGNNQAEPALTGENLEALYDLLKEEGEGIPLFSWLGQLNNTELWYPTVRISAKMGDFIGLWWHF